MGGMLGGAGQYISVVCAWMNFKLRDLHGDFCEPAGICTRHVARHGTEMVSELPNSITRFE